MTIGSTGTISIIYEVFFLILGDNSTMQESTSSINLETKGKLYCYICRLWVNLITAYNAAKSQGPSFDIDD